MSVIDSNQNETTTVVEEETIIQPGALGRAWNWIKKNRIKTTATAIVGIGAGAAVVHHRSNISAPTVGDNDLSDVVEAVAAFAEMGILEAVSRLTR